MKMRGSQPFGKSLRSRLAKVVVLGGGADTATIGARHGGWEVVFPSKTSHTQETSGVINCRLIA